MYCRHCVPGLQCCLNCNDKKPEFDEPSKALKIMLDKIEVKCTKKGCQLEQKTIKYGELSNPSHLKVCAKFIITCPLNACGKQMYNESEVSKHAH